MLFLQLESGAPFYDFNLGFKSFSDGFCQGGFQLCAEESDGSNEVRLSNYREAEAGANEARNTALASSSPYIMMLTEMETNFDFPTYVQSCSGEIV